MKSTLALTLALAAASATSAVAQTYSVYTYTATVNSTVAVNDGLGGTISFDAGDTITGQVFVNQGASTNNGGWGFPGEVINYVDSVEYFSFQHEDVSIVGTGTGTAAGDTSVNENRRFTQSASSARADVFIANSATNFSTSTADLGGGVSSLNFQLVTNFHGLGSPNLNAVTGLSLPSSVNVSLFDQNKSLNLSFTNTQAVAATLQSISVSTASSVIPEPSSYAAFAGLAVLGLAAVRRRRA